MTETEAQGELIRKLAKALEQAGAADAEPYVFTTDEVEKLQVLIAFVDKMRALKWFGKWLMWLAVGAGTLIVNWERIKVFLTGGTP